MDLDRKIRPISTARLNPLPDLHLPPINLVVFKGSSRLILGTASRLDAFSAYPNRTWLPSYAVGTTTGTPVVRPFRSSRTMKGPLQPLNAHSR